MDAHSMNACSILAVDDDPMTLNIMRLLLEQAFPAAWIRLCSNVVEVEALCTRETYDCVVIDYDMPGMDGVTCAKALRARHPHLGIVLCTGAGDEDLVVRALKNGVSDYIAKSKVTPAALKRCITNAVVSARQERTIEQQKSELETFAFALTHDFKQRIRQIETFAQLISAEIEPVTSPSLQTHLGFLGAAAGKLGKLVDVMSQYALLNQPPELETVDVRTAVRATLDSISPYVEERAGRIILEGDCIVHGHEALMIQVLQNLVINGLTYNTSRTPQITILMRTGDDASEVTVADNGIGIEAEYLEQIFKPLRRLHTQSEYPGTGLGLALVRKAVGHQHGAVWCESRPGAGSRFTIRLPTAAARTAKAAAAPAVRLAS